MAMASLMARRALSGASLAAPRLVARPQVQQLVLGAPIAAPARRGAMVIVAAEGGAAAKKKRTPQPVKRAQLAEERRMLNRSRKSTIATRTKKVMKLAEAVGRSLAMDEQQVTQLEQWVSEAYSEIDRAVSKGTLHINTAHRRKARVARFKRQALIAAGLYAPAPQQPGFFYYQRVQARRTAAAATAAAN